MTVFILTLLQIANLSFIARASLSFITGILFGVLFVSLLGCLYVVGRKIRKIRWSKTFNYLK
jgi:hypothetical protein